MSLLRIFILAVALTGATSARADQIAIAAAADLKFCLDEIVAAFKTGHADALIKVTYGSSGNFAAQIREGAPFDLYFSADIEYPHQLQKDGFVASDVVPYAVGRLVLWSAATDVSKWTLADLAQPGIGRIAIANPRHAPYGKRAEEALRASGVWGKIQERLVLGENIAQTAQFVQSGNAQVGVIALSLALSPQLSSSGHYIVLPATLHQPLEQAFVITKHGAGNALARSFAEFVQSPVSRASMVKYGFALPGESR